MSKCPFCKTRINRYDGMHIYRCNKNTKIWNKRDVKHEFLLYNFPIITNKNTLFDEYAVKLRSLPDIKKEYGLSYKNIVFLLDYFSIKRRTSSVSSKQISIKKYKKTCLTKYGVDNISKYKKKKRKLNQYEKNKDFFEKLKLMFLTNEINILKSDIDEHIKKDMKKSFKLYNIYWRDLNDEQKDYLIGKKSELESKISSFLDKMNITYIKGFKLGSKIFDIKVKECLIEVNSDYWHANPLIYNAKEYLNFPFKRTKVRMIWSKDESKKNIAIDKGYKFILIWESEIKDLNDEDMFLFLIKKLNFEI
jgi:G:T-mismatch repair DNA endonuclease (very short patch repair protein)